MTTEQFVENVLAIEKKRPSYRTGGDGSDGTCDCIGLVMGAMLQSYPLHSSNYFARCEMQELQPLSDAVPEKGAVLYKARDGKDTLNPRYLPGGRYFNGDLNDYYHAGVLVSAEPPVVVHCTSTESANGVTRDHSLNGWQYAGRIAGLLEAETIGEAVVHASEGSTVNLRKGPSLSAARVDRLAVNTRVKILKETGEWARIETEDGKSGYMMKRYLKAPEADENERLAELERRVGALEKAIGKGEE